MAEYRLYCLGADGRIWRRHDLDVADEASAREAAAALQEGFDGELWCGDRKLAFLPATRDETAAARAMR